MVQNTAPARAARWAGHEPTRQVALRLPASLLACIERIAACKNQKPSTIMRDYLMAGVAAEPAETVADMLRQDGPEADFAFDPPRIGNDILRPVEFE